MAPPKRSGGKASPYDHSPPYEESEPAAELDVIVITGKYLTPESVAEIARLVRLGVPIPVAATATGAGRRPEKWAEKGRSDRALGYEGGFELGQSPELYFVEQIEQAQAGAEADLTGFIRLAAPNDWRAAAWVLERRASTRWHLQSKLEISAKDGKGKLEISSMSTEKLLAIAKGLLPAEAIKETIALPADARSIAEGEIVEPAAAAEPEKT